MRLDGFQESWRVTKEKEAWQEKKRSEGENGIGDARGETEKG